MAQRARDRWRYAGYLKQKGGKQRLSAWQKAEVELLTDGTLLRMANDATRKLGFGRLWREERATEAKRTAGGTGSGEGTAAGHKK